MSASKGDDVTVMSPARASKSGEWHDLLDTVIAAEETEFKNNEVGPLNGNPAEQQSSSDSAAFPILALSPAMRQIAEAAAPAASAATRYDTPSQRQVLSDFWPHAAVREKSVKDANGKQPTSAVIRAAAAPYRRATHTKIQKTKGPVSNAVASPVAPRNTCATVAAPTDQAETSGPLRTSKRGVDNEAALGLADQVLTFLRVLDAQTLTPEQKRQWRNMLDLFESRREALNL
jgi:hypothetical protein